MKTTSKYPPEIDSTKIALSPENSFGGYMVKLAIGNNIIANNELINSRL